MLKIVCVRNDPTMFSLRKNFNKTRENFKMRRVLVIFLLFEEMSETPLETFT